MQSSVQAKINQTIDVAAGSIITAGQCINTKPASTDSLSQAIRNQKEADEFLEDMKIAFERADRQNKRITVI